MAAHARLHVMQLQGTHARSASANLLQSPPLRVPFPSPPRLTAGRAQQKLHSMASVSASLRLQRAARGTALFVRAAPPQPNRSGGLAAGSSRAAAWRCGSTPALCRGAEFSTGAVAAMARTRSAAAAPVRRLFSAEAGESALIQKGMGLARAGEFQGAIGAFTEEVAANPTEVHGYIYRADCLINLGQIPAAIIDLSVATALAPVRQTPTAETPRRSAHGRLTCSRSWLVQGLVSGWRTLAECHLALEDPDMDKVTQCVDALGKVAPDDLEIDIARAELIARTGDLPNALQLYQRVPRSPKAGALPVHPPGPVGRTCLLRAPFQ